MQWDIGLQGLGVLILMSLGFGVIAQLVAGRATTRWLWMIAGAAYFVGGLFISEVWFGWATEVDLQPNIDGLSFDEVLLIGLVPGILSVLITRYVTRRPRHQSAPVWCAGFADFALPVAGPAPRGVRVPGSGLVVHRARSLSRTAGGGRSWSLGRAALSLRFIPTRC